MATAVSDKVFEDGVHEFLVEVGGTGLLGFCPASFVDQRTRIGKAPVVYLEGLAFCKPFRTETDCISHASMAGKHWMNEENYDKTWVLHSSGTFANGSVCSEPERNARFTAGDRIRIRLNLFQARNVCLLHLGSRSILFSNYLSSLVFDYCSTNLKAQITPTASTKLRRQSSL